MSTNLRSYARLTFKTKQLNNLIIDSISSKILAVSTQKDITQSMGSFSITLAPSLNQDLKDSYGNDLDISDVIQPLDMVQIEFKVDDRGTDGYKTEMIGVISKACEDTNVDPQSGKPFRIVRIEGYDLGKVLSAFKMYFNPFITTPSGQEFGGYAYFANNKTLFQNLNPQQFIQTFLSFCLSTGPNTKGPIYPFALGNETVTSYIDIYSGLSTAFTTNTMTDPFILTGIESGQEVSLWDIVKAYSDPPFHEVFIDLRRPTTNTDPNQVQAAEQTHTINPKSSSSPTAIVAFGNNSNNLTFNQPYVVYMRTTPFDQDDWFNLNSHDLLLTDIMQDDTSNTEDNIFNYYEVICERENFFMGQQQIGYLSYNTSNAVPIFDNTSIQQFGLRRFPQNSTKYVEFVFNTDSQNSDIWTKQAALTRLLFRWFAYGERFQNGTITMKGRVGVGRDGITMGSRFIEKNAQGIATGNQYYIEGIEQTFVLGQPLRTTAHVTRGTNHGTRFSDINTLQNDLGLYGSAFGDSENED